MRLIKTDTLLSSSVTCVIKNHNFPWLKRELTALSSEQLVWWINQRWEEGRETRWTAVNSAAHYQAVAELLLISWSRSPSFIILCIYRGVQSTQTGSGVCPVWGAEIELKGRWWEITQCPESRGVNIVLESWSDFWVPLCSHFSLQIV